MKYEIVLEDKNFFRELAKKVKRAYYLNDYIHKGVEVITGMSSWNLVVAPTTEYKDDDVMREHARAYIEDNNLEGILSIDDVIDNYVMPSRCYVTMEYNGNHLGTDTVYGTSCSVEELASALYTDYIETVRLMLNHHSKA